MACSLQAVGTASHTAAPLRKTDITNRMQHTFPEPHLPPRPLTTQFSRGVKLLSRVRLCNPVDYSLPGSSVHGILQARILEWVAILFPTQGSNPGFSLCSQKLYHLVTREATTNVPESAWGPTCLSSCL